MKRKHRKRDSATRRVRRQARKLAMAHTKDLGTKDPGSRRSVVQSVQRLADYLPTRGGKTDWEALDVPGFFEQLDYGSRGDHATMAMHMMGFYYWLCVQQLASAPFVAEVLDGLVAQFPEYCDLAMLHRCSMIGLAGGIEAVLARSRAAWDPAALN